MARKSKTPDAIEEFESLAERAADWIRNHLPIVTGALVALLGGAAAIGGYASYQAREAERAFEALETVRADYLSAMGARPGDFDVPELANPTAAEEIRLEYVEKFREVADAHPGTVAGALARLEEGNLSRAEGDLEASLAIWRETLASQSGNPILQAILYQRIAQAYESAERWSEAAEAHEAAAAIEAYPLRYWALADALRCRVEAGEADRARALATRLNVEAPDLELPEHVRSLVRELESPSAS